MPTETIPQKSSGSVRQVPKNPETDDIPKAYAASEWEDSLYKKWEESGYFHPEKMIEDKLIASDAPVFSMVLPPPNVTGNLHVGHASMLALEDILARFHRMLGYRTLWLPGTDHAAIATQSKVENIIHKETGQTRHDFSREEFLKRVGDFAQKSHNTIVNQTKKMGSSLDWSREAYTLDETRNKAVRTAFKQMYDDGIIYQGHRIVNWDPNMQTTVSDDEIEHRTETAPLYYLQYGPFAIATARPETKFGDKYIVMHPNDPRYATYTHGQTIDLEWINGPITTTIIKDEVIDMEFGTGVMTITPWHDTIDFDIAERHHLDNEQIIDFHGKLLPIAGEFAGMHILDARPKIIEKLKSKGLLIEDKTDYEYIHNIATNSRGGGIIEPQIKKQWFIGVNREFERNGKKTTLKTLMQEAVSSGDTTILPERFAKTYFHWIDNLRDWCISRQIWYGHQIPVWYRNKEIYCDIDTPIGDDWKQDSDTLDTWFSSGLWTFSTLGWGSNDDQWQCEKIYHPTTVLETGYDILFFWVARMILMSKYFLDEVPFKKVYLHGLVRDEQGRKMSKSLGNVLDPLDIIPEYGADALRLALVLGSTPGNDIKIGTEKIKSSRNFTNKLWNIGRYVLTQSQTTEDELQLHTPADHWILARLNSTIDEVTKHLETYNFSLAGELLRDFTWNEFADWYVEIHKIEKNNTLLRFIFESILKLWHPFMPFVTEALFQSTHPDEKKLLMIESWPNLKNIAADLEQKNSFEKIIEIVTKIRNIRSIYHIEPIRKVAVTILASETTSLENQRAIIQKLARVETLTISQENISPKSSAHFPVGDLKIFVHLEGVLDIETETTRLTKEKIGLEQYISRLDAKLANKNFVDQAPEVVVVGVREEYIYSQQKLTQIIEAIDSLK